jgi:hypothetical protein
MTKPPAAAPAAIATVFDLWDNGVGDGVVNGDVEDVGDVDEVVKVEEVVDDVADVARF